MGGVVKVAVFDWVLSGNSRESGVKERQLGADVGWYTGKVATGVGGNRPMSGKQKK